MKLKIYKEINESGLIRNQAYLANFDMRDILDFTFLYLITFQILRSQPEHNEFIKDYTYETLKFDTNFHHYKSHANDMYQFLHLIYGDEESQLYLKKSKSNSRLIDLMSPNHKDMIWFLNNLRHDRNRNIAFENRFLLKLESDLMITDSNYRSIRRIVRDWDDIDFYVKTNVITRLLQAFRVRMPKSELRRELESYAKKLKLYDSDLNNPELNESISEGIPKSFWYNPKQKKMFKATDDHLYHIIATPENFGLTQQDIEDIKSAYPHSYQNELMKAANSEGWVRGGKSLDKSTNGIYLQTDVDRDALKTARQLNKLEMIDNLIVDNFDDTDPGLNLKDDEVRLYLKYGKTPRIRK